MNRPRVSILNMVSLDGWLDGFKPDEGLYYEVAGRMPHQAVLVGSGTLERAASAIGIDLAGEDASSDLGAGPDGLPLFALVDANGKITRFEWLRKQGHWGDFLVFVSRSTPQDHLPRLQRMGVRYFASGEGSVDLAAALGYLGAEFGVRDLRVDAGSALNGALIQASLVDELHLLCSPVLAARPTQRLLNPSPEEAIPLTLRDVERLRDGYLLMTHQF